MSAIAQPKPKSRLRSWLFWHSWMALPIWGYVFFVCLTGTLATVSKEILWLIDPTVRATAEGPLLPVSALITAAETAVPDGRVNLVHRDADYLVTVVEVNRQDGTSARVWIEPVTGAVQAVSTGASLPEFLRALHGWLLAPWHAGYSWGWYAVSLLAIPMIGSFITGIMAYKRFWKAFITRPNIRFERGARTWLGDLHRLGGVWSLWFVLFIGVSGLWFLIQAVLFDLAASTGSGMLPVLVPRDAVPVIEAGAPPPRPDVDALLAKANELLPGAEFKTITLPATAFDPLSLYSFGRIPFLYDSVMLNPYSGESMGVVTGGEQPGLMIAGQVLRALHVGNFGGLILKTVWFVFGVFLTGLVLSGMLIWSKRTFKAARPAAPPAITATATPAEEASHA